jgi:PAS domain S-box-containing protein
MVYNEPSGSGQSFSQSLTFRVAAVAVLVIVIVLAIFSAVFILTERQRSREAILNNGKTFANFSAKPIYDLYVQFYTHAQAANFDNFKQSVEGIMDYNRDVKNIDLLATTGRLLFDSDEFEEGKYRGAPRSLDNATLLADLKKGEMTVREVTIEGESLTQIIVPLTETGGGHIFSVRYLISGNTALAERMNAAYQQAATVSLILLVFVVGIAALLSLGLTKPIKALTRATQKIAAGDLTQRVPMQSQSEYGQLAASFNTMADKLQQVYEGLERKVAEKTSQLALKVEEVEAEKVKDDALLSSIGEGMVAIDADGRVVKVNQPAALTLGIQEATLYGKKITEAVHFLDERGQAVPPETQPGFLALHHGQKTEEVYQVAHADNTKIAVSVTSSPVRLQHRTIGVIMVIRDVTKEREVDRMKTEFISLASHQLRTPLSAIRWFSEMLLSGDAGELSGDQKEFAKNISDSTDRMIQLVSSLLNISRIESGRIIIDPKPTDIKELVSGIVSDLQAKIKEREQNLAISVHDGLGKVNLDPRMIGQVYLNLLTNAIKYTPKGGEITVLVSKKEDQIISQVTDNGYGIPKAQQGKMFQKFFRADNVAKVETDGTGLGMYLVKAIVESSGGRIWFESEEGKGTTFWFSIPASGMKARAGEVSLDT